MNILFDIQHPADCNFFKNAIKILDKEGHNIFITVLDRGNLIKLVNKEYQNYTKKIIGAYFKSNFDLVQKMFNRELGFLFYLKRTNIDITVGFGSFLLALASSLKGIFSLQFYDDFEYKANFYLTKLFADKLVIPSSIEYNSANIDKFNGFKELAYLHPIYFRPDNKILMDYGLKQNGYIFIRMVSNISLNYKNLNESGLYKLIEFLSKDYKLVLSIENKNLKELFLPYCKILEEPVEDIYSLLYYASIVLSSGDTMAREAALLGTPVIYMGERDMYVNRELIEHGLMFIISEDRTIVNKIREILDENYKERSQKIVNKLIESKWDDATDVIVEKINDVLIHRP